MFSSLISGEVTFAYCLICPISRDSTEGCHGTGDFISTWLWGGGGGLGFIVCGRGSKRTGYFTFYDDGVVVIRGDRGLYFHENTGEETEKCFHTPNDQSQ